VIAAIARMLIGMNVVLIGYRGCGKTTVGQRLAERLGYRFIDTDAEVCSRYGGMTIGAIWSQLGEAEFRSTEAATLLELVREDKQVLALGGGAVIQPAGRKVIAQADGAWRVYLKAEPQVLRQRIVADAARADRPSSGTDRNSIDCITKDLTKRDPIYADVADQVIDVADRTPEELAELISESVNQ